MDTLYTLHSCPGGAALAANQIGLDMRFFVLAGHTLAGVVPQFIFNPEIIRESKWDDVKREGCLSLKDQFFQVPRKRKITVRFQSFGGDFWTHELSGFAARLFQHEIEHLNGGFFTDNLVKHA